MFSLANAAPPRKTTNQAYQAAAALALVAFIDGGWSHVCKFSLNAGVEPLVFSAFRCIASAILLVYVQCLYFGQQPTVNLLNSFTAKDLRNYAFLGLLISGKIVGFILAESHLPAVTVSMFQPVIPAIAATLSVMFGLERLTLYKAFGVCFSTVGALIVAAAGVNPDALKETTNFEVGVIFALLHVTCSATYYVYLKMVLEYHPPVFATTVSYFFSSWYIGLAAMFSTGFDLTRWRIWETELALEGLLYAVVLATAFSYSAMAWANRETSPAVVTSFSALHPISSALIARVFLGTVIKEYQLVAGLIILMGLAMSVLDQADETKTSGESTHLFSKEVDKSVRALHRLEEAKPMS